MNKISNHKPKRSVKGASKTMKVAIPFNKKHNQDPSKEGDHVPEEMIKVPVGKNFVAPKHSSTPKPRRNQTPKPVSSNTLGKSKFQVKDCYVLVERLKKENFPIKFSAEKDCVGLLEKKQKHQLQKQTNIQAPNSVLVAAQNSVKNAAKEQPNFEGENTFVTIPSEALKNFGLIVGPPEIHSQGSVDVILNSHTCTLMETPPQTSTGCSSIGGSSSHSDGFIVDNAMFPPIVTRLVGASDPILFQSNNIEDVDSSNNSQHDPLEIGSQEKRTKTKCLPVDVHCDYLYGLNRRMNSKPDIITFQELHFSNSDVRLVAPYALKLDLNQDGFFLYAAAVSRKCDQFCCLIFGILDQYLITYSGHFIVDKYHLYDPIKKVHVNEVELLDSSLCRQFLALFNLPNKMLLEMEGYFLQSCHSSYCETQLAASEMLMFSINQVQLREKVRGEIALEKIKSQNRTLPEFKDIELSQSYAGAICPESHLVISVISKPRTEHVFFETSLPVGKVNIECILQTVKTVNCIKSRYNNFGSLQLRCATETEFFTIYYVAYGEPGCTAFYRNVFLLGYVDGHYIVGVVADKNVFIMATKRLYNRNCLPFPGMQPIKFCPKMLERIDLPLSLPYEHALIMLEARQILRHSREYPGDYQRIVESLGILDYESPSVSLFNDSELRSKKKHNAWLEKMLNIYFSSTFYNSLNEFPVQPFNSENPLLFSESVLKLWIHQLLRKIHDFEDSPLNGYINLADMSKMDFFTLDIKTFVVNFLPLFGLSDDSKFQCQLLGPDGIPSLVCSESLSANQIGAHINLHHLLPLWWNEKSTKNYSFCPFSLIYQSQNQPLSEKCDFQRLRWARSVVNRWSGGSYLELLQTLKNVDESQFRENVQATGKERQKIKTVESKNLHQKRRLASDECNSSIPKRGRLSQNAGVSISG